MTPAAGIATKAVCFHCGETCLPGSPKREEKQFCCEGCAMVYGILHQEGLCTYYDLNKNPGTAQRVAVRPDKFAFLDDANIAGRLINYQDEDSTHVCFYLPQIHCSSCMYLLENLQHLNPAVTSSRVNFAAREVTIAFETRKTSLRKLAELLTSIGYEPYISLNDLNSKKPPADRGLIARLGVAGFCFGNIMLMSFPEYLGLDGSDAGLRLLFRGINIFLAMPVLFYSAYPFFESAVKSLRHRFLNIDAPIALAILITFIRSAWEVISGTGGGYFDSMSGIVFFMLAGRLLQQKTFRQLSFDRDYTAYFPIAVSVIKNEKEIPTALPDIKVGDTLLLHHGELVPADGILSRGRGHIDYSFVTGESMPVTKETGELLYAGGRQTGANIELLVVKEVAQSYLTSLWSRAEKKETNASTVSFVHALSRYFTWIVMGIAVITGLYWAMHDPARAWMAVTAVFIIACPCALLLSNTFSNGSILSILADNQLYLRNAQTIENMAAVTHVVLDKTGTLTNTGNSQVVYHGQKLSSFQQQQLASLAACSVHPLSRAIAEKYGGEQLMEVSGFEETPGAGVGGYVAGSYVRLGSRDFVKLLHDGSADAGTTVFVAFDAEVTGWFSFQNKYRQDSFQLLQQLRKTHRVSILTGDNEQAIKRLLTWMGGECTAFHSQQPADKRNYIRQLQQSGERVMMIGDGLNDAGALEQSDVGIAVSDNSNHFTPASDGIVAANSLGKLPSFIQLCKANRKIIFASFVLSILYNLIGLFYAVQGNLSPMLAAILMPSSSFCIFMITYGGSHLAAKRMQLK